MKRKAIIWLLAVAMVITFIPTIAFGEDVQESGDAPAADGSAAEVTDNNAEPVNLLDYIDYDSNVVVFDYFSMPWVDGYRNDEEDEEDEIVIPFKNGGYDVIDWVEIEDPIVAEKKEDGIHLSVAWAEKGLTRTLYLKQYEGNTATLKVQVTNNYLFGRDICNSDWLISSIAWSGEKEVYVSYFIGDGKLKNYTCKLLLNGKTYTAKRKLYKDEGTTEYKYTFKTNMLVLGTEYQLLFSNGTKGFSYRNKVGAGRFDGSASNCVYTGSVAKPKVKVVNYYNKPLKEGVDYIVHYSKKAVNVGYAYVYVEGIGLFEDPYDKTYMKRLFKIVPQPTTINRVTAKKKGFTVSWKKQPVQTNGYQIQYSKNKNFKGAKTVTILKKTTTSKTIKKLKAKKRYYVRVRAIKRTINKNEYHISKGKKIYGHYYFCSPWSAAKSVKTK